MMGIDRLSVSVALRGLAGARHLTALTLVVVSVSVMLVVFLSALIEGLRVDLVAETTGAIPHIEVRPQERRPPPPAAWSNDDTLVLGTRTPWARRSAEIDDWQRELRLLESFDEVTAVSPVAAGQVFARRGAADEAVRAIGVLPARYDTVTAIERRLVAGRFLRLGPGEVVMGVDLAERFGVGVGDRVQLTGSGGEAMQVRVGGVFRTGFGALDDGTIVLGLDDAQSLLGLGHTVTSIAVRTRDVLAAPALARRIQQQTRHEVRDWTQDNQRLLDALDAQGRSSDMITGFTAIAAAFAVASILVVLVTNKLREIGILKAMGATRAQIQAVFAIQGTVLASLGAGLGALLGVLLVTGLDRVEVETASGEMAGLFPFSLSWQMVVVVMTVATALGLLASLVPARRAARVDPIEVIRG